MAGKVIPTTVRYDPYGGFGGRLGMALQSLGNTMGQMSDLLIKQQERAKKEAADKETQDASQQMLDELTALEEEDQSRNRIVEPRPLKQKYGLGMNPALAGGIEPGLEKPPTLGAPQVSLDETPAINPALAQGGAPTASAGPVTPEALPQPTATEPMAESFSAMNPMLQEMEAKRQEQNLLREADPRYTQIVMKALARVAKANPTQAPAVMMKALEVGQRLYGTDVGALMRYIAAKEATTRAGMHETAATERTGMQTASAEKIGEGKNKTAVETTNLKTGSAEKIGEAKNATAITVAGINANAKKEAAAGKVPPKVQESVDDSTSTLALLKDLWDLREQIEKEGGSAGPIAGRLGKIYQSAGVGLTPQESKFYTLSQVQVPVKVRALLGGGRVPQGMVNQFMDILHNPKATLGQFDGIMRAMATQVAQSLATDVSSHGIDLNKQLERNPVAKSAMEYWSSRDPTIKSRIKPLFGTSGGVTETRRQYSPSRNQTRVMYSDGSTKILEGNVSGP